MAEIRQIHVGGSTYDINDSRIITLQDNSTATAGTWLAKTSQISAYADGQMFIYKTTKAGSSSGTTLNITGSTGTALGAKTIYRSGTTKVTTQYALGTYLLLVYNSSLNSGCFMVLNDYDANTNATHSGIGICSTAASTAAKVVTFPKFVLEKNQTILLRVDATNSATSGVTLNVNSTGAKSVYIGGSAWSTSNQLNAGDYLATYDGTYWKLTRVYLTDNNTDTKNTAGSTDSSSKLFLIGATSQAANPQTYSHDTAYVGTDGCLYSGGSKVLTSHQSIYDLTIKGAGTTVTTFDPNGAANSLDIVAGSNVTITPDATNKKITIAATDTNTHYTTGLFVGATNTKSNAATSNGGTYLKLYDDSTKRAEFKISGSGATTVTSDANGNIVISSTDTNTDTNTASAADNILDGSNSGTTITYAPYASGTATSTWVGTDANAGKLYLGTVNPSKTTRLNYNGYFYGTKLYSGGSEVLTSVPNLAASKITSGTFDAARIPSLASSKITAMTDYSKASSVAAISTSDSLNTAIGKLEKALDGKQASGNYASSSHGHGLIDGSGCLQYASRVVITNGSNQIAPSDITTTELGYLDGVTSNIQTQLNGKTTLSAVQTYLEDNSEEVDLGTYFTKSDVDTLINQLFTFDDTTLIINDQ